MPEAVNDESQLWKMLREGSRLALDSIYRLHVDSLYNYGKKINPDSDLVKDCLQDLFVEIWQQREQISLPNQPRLYLIRSLRYKIIRQTGKQLKFSSPLPTEESSLSSFHDACPSLQLNEQQKKLLFSSINKLSSRQKEALLLRFYEGMDCEEIALIMDLKAQSVYNLLYQAIASLKKNLPSSLSVTDFSLLLCLIIQYLL